MKVALSVLALLVAVGCAHGGGGRKTLSDLHHQTDWQWGDGAQVQADLARGFARTAAHAGRAKTLKQVQAAGYECIYGEAHETYPEPAAVCSRGFATRACQMDWELTLTSDPAQPNSVVTTDAAFRRDCAGTANDWPVPVVSRIDDQLARERPLEGH